MDPNIRQLRHFLGVAKATSITRAATQLHISQPALTRSIHELERNLELRLFDRTSRSVELTADGSEFFGIAEEILETYSGALARFAAYRLGELGTVTIAALPSIAASILPSILVDFLRVHPDVRISVKDGAHHEVVSQVRAGEADIAISDVDLDQDDLRSTILTTDQMIAVLRVDSPLAAHDSVSWADLAAETFIAVPTTTGIRRMTDLGFERARVRPSRVLEVGAIGVTAGMVGAGLGNTAVPESVVPLMSFVPLVLRPLVEPQLSRDLAIYTRRRPRLSPSAENFYSAILEQSGRGETAS